jgi:hypothetical protein
MEKDDHIEENYYLSALLNGGTFSADYQSLHGKADKILTKDKDEGYQRSLARFVSGSYAPPTTGGEFVSDLLRRYTDEWLATGIDPDGKESPFARKLTAAKVAFAATGKYEYRLYFGKIDWDNGIERLPTRLADRLRVIPDGAVGMVQVKPIASPFASARVTQPPTKDPREWVLSKIQEKRREKRRDQTPATYTHPNMPEDVIAAANLRAIILFHALMKAPWRYRLGKCKRCQTYFVLKVNPSKTPYVRGMHCSECKSPASAGASAKTKRAEREQQLLSLAADVWSSWHPTEQFGERNAWIAGKVCKLLGERKAIQRNWVTRHEKQINAELKKRNRTRTQ